MLAFLRHIVLATGLVLAVSLGPLTAAAQPLTVSAHSVTASTQGLTAAAQPLTASAQPATAAAHPLTASAQPQTAAAQSLTAAAQSQTATFPLTFTDDAGVSTTFAAPPQRIVSLSPGLTEITFAVGAGNRLVAVDSFSEFPPEAKTI